MATGRFSRAQLNQLKICDDQGGWKLDLSGSELDRLPPAVTRIEALTSLDISDNPRLRRLPKDFHVLAKLRQLDAVHCGFDKFPPSICSMRAMTSLRLSLNNMTQYPDLAPDLQRLETLELVRCSLVEVPACVTSLGGLRHLDLKCNRLSARSFPPDFVNMKIEDLDISSNDMASIPDCILGMSSLRTLRICHCNLDSLSPAIAQLKHTTDLRLSHNNLQEIPAELCSLTQLEQLHLDHNRLTRLPRCLVNLTKLIEDKDNFMIGENNLLDPPQKLCDNGLKSIIEYYKRNN
ncbi:hypothetical protein LSH36_35g00059 [Paralvinella palmiformis]|uniref:Uncharacterized protein n=1 Tax=Paralvinella palmiformis TaxID=53620 RepID=A0AAD9K8R9_9ANNE|nr:hypothetical protein LSH36_35g00059 [Paralvinella palmiformis]